MRAFFDNAAATVSIMFTGPDCFGSYFYILVLNGAVRRAKTGTNHEKALHGPENEQTFVCVEFCSSVTIASKERFATLGRLSRVKWTN